MAITWIAPTEITPGSANSWTDADVSASVPAGSTGVILHVVNKAASSDLDIGWRKNGSTDNRREHLWQASHFWCMCGLDANRVLELYVESTSNVDVWLVGYTGSDAVFFTNAPDKSLSTTSSWQDISIAADTGADTAIAAIFEIQETSGGTWYGLRKNGSTDNRYQPQYRHTGFVVGVDANEVCEGQIGGTGLDFFLVGYFVSDSTWNTNATNVSLAGTGSWTNLTALPEGATGGFVEVIDTSYEASFGLRKDGSAEAIIYYVGGYGHAQGIVEAASLVIEGYITSTDCDFFVNGYATAAPSGVTLTVADAAHSQAAEAPTLSQVHALTVADASQAQTADSPALAQAHTLVVTPAAQAHSATAPALTQDYRLAVAAASHAQAATAPTLTQAHALAVAGAAHTQSATAPALTQAHRLAVGDASHAQAAAAPALTQAHTVAVANAAHVQTAENVTLGVAGALTVQDAAHAHAATIPSLTQAHVLAMADATHVQASENATLSTAVGLAVQDAAHVQAATAPALTQAHTLAVADTSQAHATGTALLLQAHALLVADAAHGHTAEAPVLAQSVRLVVADATHGQTAETVTISQAQLLAVADAAHAHAADAPTLSTVPDLAAVTLTDAARYAAALTDASAYGLAATDASVYALSLSDARVYGAATTDAAVTVITLEETIG